jgi:hypothetical protein
MPLGIELKDAPYPLMIMCIVGIFINMWIKNYKGRKSYTSLLIEKGTDLMKYFISEKRGDPVQVINAALGFLLSIVSVVFILLFSYKNVRLGIFDEKLFMVFMGAILFFPPVIIFCAKFTRHRYHTIK